MSVDSIALVAAGFLAPVLLVTLILVGFVVKKAVTPPHNVKTDGPTSSA